MRGCGGGSGSAITVFLCPRAGDKKHGVPAPTSCPPQYLKDGDVVEVEIEKLGTLYNTIKFE